MVTHPHSGKNVTALDYLRVDPGVARLEESAIGVIHPGDQVHRVERRLHHHLTTHPEYQFSDLVVHRVPNGVCLEGRLHAGPGAPDLNEEVFRILGRCRVINHVVLCTEFPEETDEDPYDECGCGD